VKSKANLTILKTETQKKPRLDKLKWLFAGLLIVAGIILNYYYVQVHLLVKLAIGVLFIALAAFSISKTEKGKMIMEFIRDSRVELRKVIWPTREETLQTTLVVAIMVVVLALLLWGVDGVLVWLIGWLTGQRS